MYAFVAKHFKLDAGKIKNANGDFDESGITIENENALKVFGDKGKKLPANAIKGFDNVTRVFESSINKSVL
jgi:hypothetical protein